MSENMAEKVEGRISAMGKIRNYLGGKEKVTRSELVELTGKNEVWISCAMSIFNNPNRAGKLGVIQNRYERETKSYILQS